MQFTSGTSLGEDKLGARAKILNKKVERWARTGQPFLECFIFFAWPIQPTGVELPPSQGIRNVYVVTHIFCICGKCM